MIRTLSLFSGIGAFDLGLERTGGFKTVAFCECEPFCRAVLAHHWPEVPCYDDVRTLTAARLAADGLAGIDAICGGFPCQDLSVAGRGAGLDAARSGLWHEYARLIGEILPRWVIIENVPALRSRGLDRVLGSLAAFGYDAEWHLLPAAALGAPHRRDRIWIVGHADRPGRERVGMEHGSKWRTAVEVERAGGDVADTASPRRDEGRCGEGGAARDAARGPRSDGLGGEVADPTRGGCREHGHECGTAGEPGAGQSAVSGQAMADASPAGLPLPEQPGRCQQIITPADLGRAASECHWRRAVAGLGRASDGSAAGLDRYPVATEAWEGDTPRTVAGGTPGRVPRLRALGNALVPQIPEMIGNAILRYEATP